MCLTFFDWPGARLVAEIWERGYPNPLRLGLQRGTAKAKGVCQTWEKRLICQKGLHAAIPPWVNDRQKTYPKTNRAMYFHFGAPDI